MDEADLYLVVPGTGIVTHAFSPQRTCSPAESGPPTAVPVPDVPDGQMVVLQRVQVLDALHCSQERSRMAGLAQRRGGLALGWDALQPDPGAG